MRPGTKKQAGQASSEPTGAVAAEVLAAKEDRCARDIGGGWVSCLRCKELRAG